jgi:hypothetical protein
LPTPARTEFANRLLIEGASSMFAFETLESRQHFSTVPAAAPDLSAEMTGHLPKILLAGAKIAPTMKITNTGGPLASSTLSANVYVSATPTLDGTETPFAVVPIKAKIGSNRSKSAPLKVILPSDLPADGYYLVVQLDSGAVVESNIDNNYAATTLLANPFGHYEGTVLLPGDEDPSPMGFDLTPGLASHIGSSIGDSQGGLFGVNISDITSILTPTGHYTLHMSGRIDNDELSMGFRFSFGFVGQLTDDTLSGRLSVHVRLDSGLSIAKTVQFQATKTSTT